MSRWDAVIRSLAPLDDKQEARARRAIRLYALEAHTGACKLRITYTTGLGSVRSANCGTSGQRCPLAQAFVSATVQEPDG